MDPLNLLSALFWFGYVAPTAIWCSVLGPFVVGCAPWLKEEVGSWRKFALFYGGMLAFGGPIAFLVWMLQAAGALETSTSRPRA